MIIIIIIIIIILIIIIIIIIIMVTKSARINFHLTSSLLLPYISLINANAERLKAKLRGESN